MRNRIFGLSAMIAVGLMAVTTSIPAFAVNSVARGSAPLTASRPALATQSFTSNSSSTVAAIQRDGYTSAAAPKPVPVKPQTMTASRAPIGLDSGQLSSQGWSLPVSGYISSPFGPRPDRPVAGVGDFHKGTDLATACGQPVFAATGGTVISAGWFGTYGNWVLIDHGDGVQTGYAHNSEILVSEGETVSAGQNIAAVGNTGASSGCHLHFETRVDNTPTDPESFMVTRGVLLG